MCHSLWETGWAWLSWPFVRTAPEQSPPTRGGGNGAQGGGLGGSPGGHLVPRPGLCPLLLAFADLLAPSVQSARPAAQQELKRRHRRFLILHFYLQP